MFYKKFTAFLIAIVLKSIHIAFPLYIGLKSYVDVFKPLAEAERGYSGAVGGEFLAAMMITCILYYIVGKILSLALDLVCEIICAKRKKKISCVPGAKKERS